MFDRTSKLEKAVRRNPRAPLFARLADHYLRRGRVEQAVVLCEEGCERFPDYPTGHLVLSRCYEAQDQFEEARTSLDRGLRLDPQNPAGFRQLSRIYAQMGNGPLALKSLEAAAQLDPFSDSLAAELEQLIDTGTVAPPEPTQIPPRPAQPSDAAPSEEPEQQAAMPPSDAASAVSPPGTDAEEGAFEPSPASDEPFGSLQSVADWDELAATPPIPGGAVDPSGEQISGLADNFDEQPEAAAELTVEMDPVGEEEIQQTVAGPNELLDTVPQPAAEIGPETAVPGPDFADLDDELATLGAEVADLGIEIGAPELEIFPAGDDGMSPQTETASADDDETAAFPEPTAQAPQLGPIAPEISLPVETDPAPGTEDATEAALEKPLTSPGPNVSRFGNGDNELVQLLHQIEDGDRAATPHGGEDPVLPVATTTLARLYADQGFPGRAIDTYQQVLDRNPDNEEVRAALAGLQQST